MVVLTDAVVDIGAVMVEAFYASIACAAVERSVRPDNLTVRAEENWIEYLHQFEKIDVFRFLEVAGILAEGPHME